MTRAHWAVAAAALVAGPAARAEFIRSTTGIPAPLSTITFDEHVFPRFTQITTQYLDTGISFAPRAWYDVIVAELPHITGHRVGNSAVGELDDPMSIRFATSHTEAALALACNNSNLTFTALLNGAIVESITVVSGPVTNPENFYGFTGIVFNEISISQQVLSGSAGFIIDHIQLGPVPGPGGAAVLAAAGVVALGRRRRRGRTQAGADPV